MNCVKGSHNCTAEIRSSKIGSGPVNEGGILQIVNSGVAVCLSVILAVYYAGISIYALANEGALTEKNFRP